MMKRRVQIALAFSGGAVAFVGGCDGASDAMSVFSSGSAMAALGVFVWSGYCWCFEVVMWWPRG
jgi:hypothetical protein